MSHQALAPFQSLSGPRSAKILIVGEAWGQTESETGEPFAGESGKELFRMLGEAMPHIAPQEHADALAQFRYGNSWLQGRKPWLQAASIAFTNVLAFRPPANKIDTLCITSKELEPGYDLPAISHGRYLHPQYLPELLRLREELGTIQPNIVIAMGNTACWALLQATNVGSIRGAIAESRLDLQPRPTEISRTGHLRVNEEKRIKVLPTYHPAGVLRNWAWRPIVVADLMKAERESHFREIRRPQRSVLVSPTLAEVKRWTHETLANPPPFLSPDIETGAGQIKCIGFARSVREALVVPFVDLASPGGNYWSTSADEYEAWLCVQALLESPIPKVGQNFLYDLQYIIRTTPIRPKALAEDTMLLHHSLYPEMLKGLGFLGSIYTNEISWKLMRRKRPDSEKRDE